jgi:putative membrane protein insertion efficiency factor
MSSLHGEARAAVPRCRRASLPARAVVLLVRLYQAGVSPLLGQNCRFEPSCSQYVAEAVGKHGLVRGLWLGCGRILRCHPLSKGGYDPVS